LTGSQEKLELINLAEKYVSVVTAMARVKWASEKDYSGVELLMNEGLKLVTAVSDRIAVPKEPVLEKLKTLLNVNLAHAVYMQEGRHQEAITLYE